MLTTVLTRTAHGSLGERAISYQVPGMCYTYGMGGGIGEIDWLMY